ncbi:N-acyl amino acid synthase FeeM domain-containing protein [Desulfonatronum thiodismutans]|uniref:N-acyl amino acid synthase FeeM domain-containing protein n=1 Tax=Desulfonatronum thiodismutans TaxID=159290 RepID=UPI00068CB514|nr:hypothetical protein [Desulfonatronum thiodismutans]
MYPAKQRWLPFPNETFPATVLQHAPDDVDYVFKLADDPDELCQAYHLLYREYLNVGYIQESPGKLLFTPHHLLPTTTVFLAKSQEAVLSTATLVHDSKPSGLPMDALFHAELDTLRAQNRRILEVCSLASDRCAFSRRGIQNFTKLIFLYCVFLDIDDVCIMVNPRHVHLYKNRCEFEIFAEEKYYPKVNAMAVALRANVHKAREKLDRVYLKFSYQHKLFSHYLSLSIALDASIFRVFGDVQSSKTCRNPLDANVINRFLGHKADALSDVPLDFKKLLHESYPGIRI